MGKETKRPRFLLASTALATLLGACSTQDGSVGAVPGDAGPPPTLTSDFAADQGIWNLQTMIDGADVRFGVAAAGSNDGKVVELRLPGRSDAGPDDFIGPLWATEMGSKSFLRFGTLRTAVRFPTCQPSEEVAAAVFLYTNDGLDHDGDGTVDNPEMDLHWLCGSPGVVVMTVWTDYQKSPDGSERFVRRSHAVDLSNGELYDTLSDTAVGYGRSGTDPLLARPGSLVEGAFLQVGYDWQATAVRFFIVIDGSELTLWTLTDTALIPQIPLQLRYNLWHPNTHWVPTMTSASYPKQDAVLAVDWFTYWAP